MVKRLQQKPIKVRKSIDTAQGGISSHLTIAELTTAYPVSRGWLRSRMDKGELDFRMSGKTVLVDFRSFLTCYEESQIWLDIIEAVDVY